MARAAALVALTLLLPAAADIAVCPGEGARYEDFKCNHDQTHRVCAKLLDSAGQPLAWGSKGNFWEITGQTAFQWDSEIRANGGDSWCICMWATARLIMAAGCENVHIDCAATDVSYVEKSYMDGGVDLAPAKKCLEQKCPSQGSSYQRLSDATMPEVDAGAAVSAKSSAPLTLAAVAAAAIGSVAVFMVRRSQPMTSAEAEYNHDVE
eukprot:gb/GFBE01019525.1/.p1 GENE.gb/GFBE01019525.1/~~gb/GFBE01019525.1/.p1  ORF type:complete len:208 (+),score=54.85 gb/GFBE01019525.1/:1-624(+)